MSTNKTLVSAVALTFAWGLAPLAAQQVPLLAVDVARAAPAASPELESFRNDLKQYVAELRALPPTVLSAIYDDAGTLATADQRIAAMSDAELAALKEALDRIPYWRAVPTVFAAAVPPGSVNRTDDLRNALEHASGGDPERFRQSWMALLDRMERVPATMVSPGFHANVARLKVDIAALGADDLRELQRAILARLPVWQEKLLEARNGGTPGSVRSITGAACEGGLAGIICRIEEAIDDLISLGTHVFDVAADAVVSIFDDLTSLLGDLTEALPTDPSALLGLMGIDLDDPDWFQSVLASVPILEPPCPPDNIVMEAFFGEMGTAEAFYSCKRSIHWISEAVYENAPDDLFGTPFKVPFAAVFYPIDYLCLCYESAWQINDDDQQGAHQALTQTNLDVDVSTRASQTNLDGAAAQVSDIDGDVAAVEAKLDILDGKADDILDGAADQGEFLLDFQDLALRMLIEANLFRNGNDRVSIFQLPASVGGFLEEVREVVGATIEARLDAGIGIGRAAADLAQGDAAYARGAYKEAYGHYRRAYQQATQG